MENDIDIFTTPPLLTAETDSAEKQQDTAQYRLAIEGVAAIVESITTEADSSDTQEILSAIAADLSDGEIDGEDAEGSIDAFDGVDDVAASVAVDPSALVIPGSVTEETPAGYYFKNELYDIGQYEFNNIMHVECTHIFKFLVESH